MSLEGLDLDLLKALEESKKQYEMEQQKAKKDSKEAENEDLELLQAIAASEKEYQAQLHNFKTEGAVDSEVDDELSAAIALSKQLPEKISPAMTSPSSNYLIVSEAEAIRLQRILTLILKIPGTDVEGCLDAIKMQQRFNDASLALAAYENSTKEYSAQGLIAFMKEVLKPEVTPDETEGTGVAHGSKLRK